MCYQQSQNTSILSDHKYLYSAGNDEIIRVWECDTKQCVRVIQCRQYGISSLMLSQDHKYLYSKVIRKWSCATECLQELDDHSNWVNFVKLSSDDQCLYSGSNDATIRIWRCDDDHTSFINNTFLSSDSKYLYSAADDETIRV